MKTYKSLLVLGCLLFSGSFVHAKGTGDVGSVGANADELRMKRYDGNKACLDQLLATAKELPFSNAVQSIAASTGLSQIVIHDLDRVYVYGENGKVTINGNACDFDRSKKTVDALEHVADRLINSQNPTLEFPATKPEVRAKGNAAISRALQACKKAVPEFKEYADAKIGTLGAVKGSGSSNSKSQSGAQ